MSAFSDFIRNATPEDKGRVYDDVMKRAAARQNAMGGFMTFEKWWEQYTATDGREVLSDYEKEPALDAWNAAIAEARRIVLAQGAEAREAAKAKDATDYVAGYQDATVDCDEELRDLAGIKEE